jgi:hypothetical protein
LLLGVGGQFQTVVEEVAGETVLDDSPDSAQVLLLRVEPPTPSSLLYGDGAPVIPLIAVDQRSVIGVPSPYKRQTPTSPGCTKTPERVHGFNRNGCTETPGIATSLRTKESPTSITGTARFVLTTFYIAITPHSGHTPPSCPGRDKKNEKMSSGRTRWLDLREGRHPFPE